MTQHFVLNVRPVAAPRQSRRDSWNPSPPVVRYRRFKDSIRLTAQQSGFVAPCSNFAVRFYLEPPPSWSKKKIAAAIGKPHKTKPDLDNLMKAMLDALLPDDDSHVWQFSAAKYYGIPARIEVSVFEDAILL